MRYHRTLWEGEALYTCLTTGQIQPTIERIVIVDAFDNTGLMHQSFKVAYLDENDNVGLKLALTNRKDASGRSGPWYLCDDGPFCLSTTTDYKSEGNALVGDLDKPYAFPTDGQIKIWTLKPFQSYRTWNYDRFWGGFVSPVFKPPLAEVISKVPGVPADGMRFLIDGWGHESDSRLVRTMCYSVQHGAVERMLYMKSSTLTRTKQDVQEGKCFDTFI